MVDDGGSSSSGSVLSPREIEETDEKLLKELFPRLEKNEEATTGIYECQFVFSALLYSHIFLCLFEQSPRTRIIT